MFGLLIMSLHADHVAEHGFQGEFISNAKCYLRHVVASLYKTGGGYECRAPKIAALVKTQRELLARVDALSGLPTNPLDELIDELGGPDNVAEMTGRATRIVRRPADRTSRSRSRGKAKANTKATTVLEYERRDKGGRNGSDTVNITERKNFQDGKKLVAIISDAASTGVSLQADRRVAMA